MRNQIRIVAAALCAGLLFGTTINSQAASIGASFVGRDPGFSMLPTDVAGVVPQSSWNNVPGEPFTGTTSALLDNTGGFTDVKLVYAANDSWKADGPTVTTDDKLMKGIIKMNPDPDLGPIVNGTDRMIFTITNLAAGNYNVLVYLGNNGLGGEVSLNAGGAITYYVSEEASFTGTFVRSMDTTPPAPGSWPVGANYAQFDNVPSAGGAITITVIKNIVNPQVADGGGVCAIQITSTGNFPPNTTPSSITTPPASTGVLVGTPATFNVVAAGPAKFQWQKNGANIAGATAPTYTTPPTVTGDSGATFRVVVYNNVNTNTSPDAILTVGSPQLTQGFLTVQQWNGVTATLDEFVVAGDPGAPAVVYFIAGANQPNSVPDVSDFASAMSGWIVPTVSGNYDFFIKSDDASKLYLNTTAAVSGTNALPYPWSAAATAPICEEFGCCGAFVEPGTGTETTATPIALEAGKYYGIVGMLKEGGGGDNMAVAWRLTTDTTPAASLNPIAPGNTYTLATPLGQTANITTQPASVTVAEARPATFRAAVVTTPTAGLSGIQWLKNGVAIPGANGPTYTISRTTLAQSGETYQARFYTLAGLTNSALATLTVLPDTFAPVARAGAITTYGGQIQVGITFDEDVNIATLVAGNFTLNGGSGTFSLAQNSFQDYTGVLLNTTGLTPGSAYTVTVKNVADVKGNAITTTNVPFTVGKVAWSDTGVPIRPSAVVPVGNDGFDVLNGGRTEWASYDEIAFVHVQKTNDFDVKLQVIYAEPSSQWGRVGLHARNDLDVGAPRDGSVPFSAYAQTHANPNKSLGGTGVWPASDPIQPGNANANNGYEQNQRNDTGAATSGWGNTGGAGNPVYPNVWFRLKRVGAVIEGFRSPDGVAWTSQGTVTLAAQTNIMFVGPSISAETGNIGWTGFDVNNDPFNPTYDRLFLAQYRNFGDVSVPVPPANLTVGKSGANVVISWTAGVLQSSPSLTTPAWNDVAGATSPFSTPATGVPTWYRLRGTE